MKTEWIHKKLGDCCESELGKTLDEGRNTGLYRPYLCALNVLWGKIDRSTIKRMRIEDSELERYLVKKGDLLVCEGGEIGRCAIWEYDDVIYYQNALHRVRFYDGYDARFFMYLLCHYNDLKLIEQYGKGLTIKHLNQTAFRNIPVCVPDLPAQRRIAAILASADKVIAATQKTIAKYKQIRQGMMEDLLKPKEGWKMVKLGECLKQKPDYGINAPAVPFDNNLPTYLRITDITEDGYYSKKDIVSVSSQDALKYVMEKGDLVFARTGASTGKTYLYDPKDGMLVFAGFLIRVRTDENVLLPEFFKYQTQTPQYKNWIDANSMRTGQPGINGNEYEAYPVSIPYKNDKPDLPAQRRIAAILSGIDAKIAAEEKGLEKYEKVKKGLMEKLLNEQCTMNN